MRRRDVVSTGGGLGHVRWLGGATGAGKTAIAARLAATFGLRRYSTDDAIPAHGARPGRDAPLLREFQALSMDERWLSRDARTMFQTFPWFAGERFDRIAADLRTEPPAPVTLAEGFRLLPRLVQPLLDEPWQALWLTATPELRRRAFAGRPETQQFWRRTSRPAAALERLLERDALFAEHVADEAQALGLKVVVVDGSRPEAAVADEVADWFRLRQGASSSSRLTV